jgi:hypothetical protein
VRASDHEPERPKHPTESADSRPTRVPAKLKPIDEPPVRPPITELAVMGFVVARYHGGLQQAGTPDPQLSSSRSAASYGEAYVDIEDAIAAAREQLIRGFARGTFPSDQRHIVPVVVRDWPALDYRPVPMPARAIAAAAETLADGTGAEPWWQAAKESQGGIILPWPPTANPDRSSTRGFFLLMFERYHAPCLELRPVVHTITLHDVLDMSGDMSEATPLQT